MRLCDIVEFWPVSDAASKLNITSLSADSRRLSAGGLFFAISGNQTDGHDHIADAIANGAIAVIGEKPLKNVGVPYAQSANIRADYAAACAKFWPKRPAIQAAITGTNGKTSIAEFLRQIWQKSTWQAASIGTLGAKTAKTGLSLDEPHLAIAGLTTPGPDDLFAAIDGLARDGVRCLALEASSHGIDQDRLQPLAIHVAGFSNLSRDHLDYHGDMAAYFATKLRLFTELLPDGGAAVINQDDAYGQKIIKAIANRPIVLKTIGTSADADLHIKALTAKDYGFDAQFTYDGKDYHYPLALMGRFQVENALLAALMAHLSGLSLHDAFGALPCLLPIAGRMQPVHGHPQKARILVDYAHTPDALENALQLLRPETSGKLIVLFGCGGDRDKGKRAMMGDAAAKLADMVYVTDDNPRSEDPAAIRAEVMSGLASTMAEKFCNIGNRKAAIQTAIDTLGAGDTLLIAGKGHETTQMVGTETLPFDDSAVARSALAFLPQGGVS